MKLVITTKELSPCGDTAKELTAGTAFLGSRRAPSPWDPKTTRAWLGGWLLSTLNLCPWVPPWEAGGGLGSRGVTSPLLLPTSGGTGGAFSLVGAASNVPHQPGGGPKHRALPGDDMGKGLWQEPPALHRGEAVPWVAPWKAGTEDPTRPCCMGSGWEQPPQPLLPPYLRWENVIHHVPDVRAQDALVGQRYAFELHRHGADDAVLRLVALLVEENPPGGGR